MKVCLMCEGSYPYVTGGVSSWVHLLMTSLKDIEFYISALTIDRTHSGQFKYKMPSNLVSINEIYLQDADYVRFGNKMKLSKAQKDAFRSFIMGQDIDWATIFDFFANHDVSVNGLLMGTDLLDIIMEFYEANYPRLPFTDFLWTYRSMMLPICTVMKNQLPKADIYHSASTGYSGILACMAKYVYNKPAVLTEHGIYTREREEDIIQSPKFAGHYKDMWISHFYKLSDCAYKYSDRVVSLFEEARQLQIDLGCNSAKTLVIPNGVNPKRFDHITPKQNPYEINLGLIARISPIKDIKTLINAYGAAKEKVTNLNLYIMGGVEEDQKEYYDECIELVKNLDLKDVIFTGNIDLTEYMGRLDMVILTSISEGQPISILEAMSARKPCIATQVGNCDEMLLGFERKEEPCGIITPIMSVEAISNAIIEMAANEEKRKKYGETARDRVEKKYHVDDLIKKYRGLYTELYNSEK